MEGKVEETESGFEDGSEEGGYVTVVFEISDFVDDTWVNGLLNAFAFEVKLLSGPTADVDVLMVAHWPASTSIGNDCDGRWENDGFAFSVVLNDGFGAFVFIAAICVSVKNFEIFACGMAADEGEGKD